MAKDTRLSQQAIRTACQHLKSTNEITSKSTNRFTVYTIVNYEKYQNMEDLMASRTTGKSTNNQPTINQQSTTSVIKKQSKKNTMSVPDHRVHVLKNFFIETYKKKYGVEHNWSVKEATSCKRLLAFVGRNCNGLDTLEATKATIENYLDTVDTWLETQKHPFLVLCSNPQKYVITAPKDDTEGVKFTTLTKKQLGEPDEEDLT